MKILHTVQLYHPAIGGSEEAIKQLSERLVKRGHQVTVATTYLKNRHAKKINGVNIEEFSISGNNIFGITGEKEKYQSFLKKGNFDIILNYGTQIWSTDLMFDILSDISAKKLLVPMGLSSSAKSIYQKYYQEIPTHLKQYNKIIYLSDNYEDKYFGDKNNLTNGITIPNAANEDEFLKPSPDFRKKYDIKTTYFLLNVSNHYPHKGHKFLIKAFKKLKRNDVTLLILGQKPVNFWFFFFKTCFYSCKLQQFFCKNLKILNKVSREDTVAAFKDADLFILGSKFEGSPLVIFESMASKTPFVSTDCGNVKEYEAYGSIVKSPKGMAQKINEWLNDESKRNHVGEAAYKNWQENYTWEKITDQYENLYKSLMESHHNKI